MSFSITYHPLFRVRCKEQGSEKVLDLLRFSPDRDTEKLLGDYMLIFKKRKGGFDIYYETNDYASPALITPIENHLKFTFFIEVLSHSFFAEYEPDFDLLPQFYLDNLTTSGNISNAASGNLTKSGHFKEDDLYKIYPRTFRVVVAQNISNPPTRLMVKDPYPPKNTIQTIDITNPDSADTVQVLINDPVINEAEFISNNGPYILQLNKANPPPQNIYLLEELSRRKINGILDLHWKNTQDTVPQDTGKEFQIILKRK